MRLFAKRTTLGLDIGSHSIKAAQLQVQGSGIKVTRLAEYPTPPNSIRDGVVVDIEPVAEAIKSLLKENAISATHAVVAAAGGSVLVRPVAFPRMPEATLRKTIRFEASRYVLGSPEDCFIEFEIIGNIDGDRMNVLIVAAPKDIVESRIKACELAGLQVDIVDVEAFAMYRSLVENFADVDASQEGVALVDIGATTTNVSVVHKGVFFINRSVPNGGRLLTESLKSTFKLSEEDAESGKSQLDVSDLIGDTISRDNPPLRVIQPHIDDLIREIRRSLNYFQSQQIDHVEGRKVDRIVIAGGGAKLKGLASYLESKVGIPVASAGVLTNPSFSGSLEWADDALDYAVATGLALRAGSKAA